MSLSFLSSLVDPPGDLGHREEDGRAAGDVGEDGQLDGLVHLAGLQM